MIMRLHQYILHWVREDAGRLYMQAQKVTDHYYRVKLKAGGFSWQQVTTRRLFLTLSEYHFLRDNE